MPRYKVVCRTSASFCFREGDCITINYPRDGVVGRVAMASRYNRTKFDVPVPGDLSVIIEVDAPTIDEASTWTTVGIELANILAVATNAAVGTLKPELIYDISPEKAEREYFQRCIPEDEITLSSRTVLLDPTIALLRAVGTGPERNRLLRTITQYEMALRYWQYGHELLILSHLWMGVEAISKAYLRAHLRDRAITPVALADEWGFDPNGSRKAASFLDEQSRLRLTCQNDREVYSIAKAVSDNFEHGLKNGGRLFGDANSVYWQLAKYLRTAIFTVAQLSDADISQLKNPPYEEPRGPLGLEYYLHGLLISDGHAELGATGNPDPFVSAKIDIGGATLDTAKWKYSYKLEPSTFTPHIGEKVQFQLTKFEVWDSGIYRQRLEINEIGGPK